MTPSKAKLGYLLARGILIVLAKLTVVVLVFVVNVVLLWNYFRLGHRITAESPARIFAVVVLTSNNAELFLVPGKLDEYLELKEYLDAHPDYSFLIPSDSQAAVQEQIQASYHRRYYSGKSQPYLSVKPLGVDRQLIEFNNGWRSDH